MSEPNTKAKYLLEDVDFSKEGAHLAYTVADLGGAASNMNEAFLFKSEDLNLSEEEKKIIEELVKAEKLKTIGSGQKLPASEFAYVGDPERVATWKFPINDKDHVQQAVARLGQEKGIPASEMQSVKRKIRTAYEKYFPDADKEHVDELFKSMFTFDNIEAKIHQALKELFPEKMSSDGMTSSYVWLRDASADKAYFEYEGKCYQISYSLPEGRVVLGNDMEEVYPQQVYEPVNKSIDASDEADSSNADQGIKNGDTMSEVNIDKAQLDELLKMKEQLEAYQAKEKQEKLNATTELVKSAGFITKSKEVVTLLMESEVADVIKSVIDDAVEAVKKAKEDAEASVKEKLEAAEEEVKKAKAHADQIKEDFGKPAGLEGDNNSQQDYDQDVKKSSKLADFINAKHNK